MAHANPFHYGQPVAGNHPELFVDREEQLQTLITSMLGGRNVVLLAPRRYGKTSLLYQAIREVRARGGTTGRVSLIDCATPRDVAETLLRGVIADLGWVRRSLVTLREQLAAIRGGPAVEFTHEGGVKVSFAAHRREEQWREVIGDVLRLLARAEQREPVSFVIDEFQQAHTVDPALVGVVKRLTDDLPEVSLVLSGSQRQLMEQLTHGAGAPLARVGTTISLPRIPEDQLAAFLGERAASGGKVLAPDVAVSIYRRANGIPNEVQQLAYWAFEAAGRRINDAAVQAGLDRLVGHSRFEFVAILGTLAPAQQKLLRILAAEGPVASIQTGVFAERVEVSNPSGVLRAARALEARDIIERAEDGWQVTNPFLATWLREWTAFE